MSSSGDMVLRHEDGNMIKAEELLLLLDRAKAELDNHRETNNFPNNHALIAMAERSVGGMTAGSAVDRRKDSMLRQQNTLTDATDSDESEEDEDIMTFETPSPSSQLASQSTSARVTASQRPLTAKETMDEVKTRLRQRSFLVQAIEDAKAAWEESRLYDRGGEESFRLLMVLDSAYRALSDFDFYHGIGHRVRPPPGAPVIRRRPGTLITTMTDPETAGGIFGRDCRMRHRRPSDW